MMSREEENNIIKYYDQLYKHQFVKNRNVHTNRIFSIRQRANARCQKNPSIVPPTIKVLVH